MTVPETDEPRAKGRAGAAGPGGGGTTEGVGGSPSLGITAGQEAMMAQHGATTGQIAVRAFLQGNQGAGLDTNGDRKQPTTTANDPGPTRPPSRSPMHGEGRMS